jgi:hypothetical protein
VRGAEWILTFVRITIEEDVNYFNNIAYVGGYGRTTPDLIRGGGGARRLMRPAAAKHITDWTPNMRKQQEKAALDKLRIDGLVQIYGTMRQPRSSAPQA